MIAPRDGYQGRQNNPNGRRPRTRHHSGSTGDRNGDRNNGGGNGGGGNPITNASRPRSASSLRHQSFDSNCGDLRVRGNAWQVYEKYQALARDAASGGDRVAGENYLQHAEHYFRIIEAINEATAVEQRLQGEPVTAYNQQPEIPANYYTQNTTPLAAPAGEPAAQTVEQQPQAEATVQTRTPQPQQPSPFFTQEEIDEHNQAQSLAAAR